MTPIHQAVQAFVAGQLECTSERIDFDSPSCSGECEMRYFRSGANLVIFCSDIDDNPGTPITDAAPAPWEAAESALAGLGDLVTWVEHRREPKGSDVEDVFDQVTLRGRVPSWRRITMPAASSAEPQKQAKAA
jgi:hypothetical protein